MKNYKSRYVRSEEVMVDDHIKIAGFLYRVHKIILDGKAVEINFYSVAGTRRVYGYIVLSKNRLMKIWNQK